MTKYGNRIIISDSSFIHALCLFGTFGAFGVLIDLDHIPILLQKGLPITAENLVTEAARPLHLPVFFLLGIICLTSLAFVYRLRNSSL